MTAIIAVVVTLLVTYAIHRLWWARKQESFSKEKYDIHYQAFKDGWAAAYEYAQDEIKRDQANPIK